MLIYKNITNCRQYCYMYVSMYGNCIHTMLMKHQTVVFWGFLSELHKTPLMVPWMPHTWEKNKKEFYLIQTFRSKERIWRVESNYKENKKAEKNGSKTSKKQKKWNSSAKNKNKYWLMRMHQSKILYIFWWNLNENVTEVWKSAFLAKFR